MFGLVQLARLEGCCVCPLWRHDALHVASGHRLCGSVWCRATCCAADIRQGYLSQIMRAAAALHKPIGIALRFRNEVGRSGEPGDRCVVVDAMERVEGKEKRGL